MNDFIVPLIIGIIVITFLKVIYDILKRKMHRFSWLDGVRCRRCGHLIAFCDIKANLRFTERPDTVSVSCPCCGHEAQYGEKEWISGARK